MSTNNLCLWRAILSLIYHGISSFFVPLFNIFLEFLSNCVSNFYLFEIEKTL